MSNELVVRNEMDIMTLGKVLAESNYFSDSKQSAQAIVKVIAGQELGFGPVASMTGINIIQGKVAIGANLLAAAIKRSGRYNYRVIEHSDDGCKIEFFEGSQSVGVSEFNKSHATAAGLLGKDNWKKFPRNMYFSRALSNGQKWYCPDVGNGAPLYTPEELGAEVDSEDNIIEMPVQVVTEEPPTPKAPKPAPVKKPDEFKFPTDAAKKFYDDCVAKCPGRWKNEFNFMKSMEKRGYTWTILNDDNEKVKAFEALIADAQEQTLDEVFSGDK